MSSLFHLKPKATAKAIAGRKLVSVRCCDEFMCQKELYCSLPTDKKVFGTTLIILECSICSHRIEIETSLSRFSKLLNIWKYLDVEDPYRK